MSRFKLATFVLALLVLLMTAACNLTSAPEESISNTQPATPIQTTLDGTIVRSGGELTTTAVTGLPPLTQFPPTSVVQLPPTSIGPAATPSLTSIFILSPIPGNVVAGNVQVLGSAVHPNFLQYQLEFGPEPNPGNLWYLIGGVRLVPVTNNLLGVWTTTDGRTPDGTYQLRLRVFLRDGTIAQTVVNTIRVQNQVPTQIPTATQSVPRPIAAFTASPPSGKSPLVVSFTNRSSGNISGYSWNFGDGSTSAENNPVHTFRTAGSYEVKLTVTGPGGQSNVSTIIDVQTADPPVASFMTDRTSGTAPLTVQFTDQSTGPIDSYLWDFGDGVTTNERSPRHTFSEPRLYNVILRVQGPGGTDRERIVIVVEDQQVRAPVADFSPKTTSGNPPLSVTFTSSATGQINSYEWDFGDGTTSNEQNPTHVYQNAGTYTVRLNVFGNGGRDEETGTVTVTQPPQAPDANFTADRTEGDFPLTVQFTNTTTGTVTGYSWNFGDNTTSTEQNPRHIFQSPGTYLVRLTAFGANNTSDTRDLAISVTAPLTPPDANFTANPTSGSRPLNVTFSNQSSGDNISFAWNFGDGNSSLSQDATVTHTYTSNGSYTVTLTVTNSDGVADTSTLTITVSDALNAAFTSTALSNQPQTFQFQSTSSGDIASYRWDFGNGAIIDPAASTITHTYTSVGTFNVTLTIRDRNGAEDSVTQQINVVAPTQTPTLTSPPPTQTPQPTATPLPPTATLVPPTATVEPPTQTALPPLDADFRAELGENGTVNFFDQSTPPEGITARAWDFDGDGDTDAETAEATFQFPENGTYNVTLVVFDQNGNSSLQTKPVEVTGVRAPLTANFSVETTDNRTFSFLDLSLPAETITRRQWDFNTDGVIDIEGDAAPEFTFSENRLYTVTLTVTDDSGQSDTFFAEVNVTGVPAPLNADFRAENADNGTVNFFDQSTGAVARWQWDFGDGSTSTEQNPVHSYAENRTYSVTLTVFDANNQPATISKDVVVENFIPPLTADFRAENAENGTVNFFDQSTGAVARWQWDFGDGSTSTEQNPVHSYAENRTYSVTLTVFDANNQSAAIPKNVVVENFIPPLTADFRAETADNGTVNFFDQSTGTVESWLWDFGDGSTSTDQNPVHSYTENREYTVTLTVTNAGQSDSEQKPVVVENYVPPAVLDANFTFESPDGFTFNFTDLSTSSQPITSWVWNFGDGGSSLEQNPTYTFTANGSYEVTLTVTDQSGAPDTTDPQTVIVENIPDPIEETESIADTTSILPNMESLAARLSELPRGERSTDVFTVVADKSFKEGFLRPFGRDDGSYIIGDQFQYLTPTIDAYRTTDTFRADWLIDSEMTLERLLNESPDGCNGETLFVCELTRSNASVVIISVGIQDVQNDIDLETFRQQYDALVNQAVERGVIPVALTLYPRPDLLEPLESLNSVIIEVAEANDIPVVNIWRMSNEINERGGTAVVEENNYSPSVAEEGAGVIRTNAVENFGENARNYHVLQILNDIREQVFGIGGTR